MTVNSKFEKWNNLPEEMKLECIKWLDLKTRFRLRSTSHTERRLVNSKKFKIPSVRLLEEDSSAFHILIKDYIQNYTIGFTKMDDFAIPLIKFLLETFHIDRFMVHDFTRTLIDILSQIDGTSKYHINYIRGPLPLSFFGKCAEHSIKEMSFDYFMGRFSADELLKYPSINSIKKWTIRVDFCFFLDCIKIAKKWMEIDVDIGSKFHTTRFELITIDDFVNAFEDIKMCKKSNKMVRFETQNDKKHMILNINSEDENFVLFVIPAESEETDYNEYGNKIQS